MTAKDKYHKKYLLFIIIISLGICLSLSYATAYINYWPTDSQNPYIPTASKLLDQPAVSQMHDIPVNGMLRLTMRGKETLILGIAFMQKMLGDTESLYPNILFLIICFFISSILVYLIIRNYFDSTTGLIGYILFTFCHWTYVYILQGAHQPLVLTNFLLALFLLQQTHRHKMYYLYSGIAMGLMIFSSPTAAVFMIYFTGLYFLNEYQNNNFKSIAGLALNGFILILGASAVFIVFTYPNPLQSIRKFINFLEMSRHRNNFMIYRDFLSQHFIVSQNFRGGGVLWILKYCLLIMPVLFPAYLICNLYLLKKSVKSPKILLIILLCLSSPIAVEYSKVVQFGRNYFPWIVGVIGLIAFFVSYFRNNYFYKSSVLSQKTAVAGLAVLLASHIGINSYQFLSDIYPARMATTDIYTWCKKNGISRLHVYYDHPRNKNIGHFLNNPKYEEKISFNFIRSVSEPAEGYILIPPISGKTIYGECREGNYAGDPELTKLLISGALPRATAASFKTLGTSRIWAQEEEICTYRDLMLNQISAVDRQNGRALILDAGTLKKIH